MGLDSVELIILIEKELGINFVDSEISKISTVYDVSKYAYILQKGTHGKTLVEVQNIIIDLSSKVSGLNKSEITLGSDLVKDIGLD